jgi:competence protein ComEC
MRRILTLVLAFLLLGASVAIQPSQQPSPPAKTQTKQQTVYITNTGKKYHTATCRYLSHSKIPISLKDAKAQGYTACSVCKPPQ